MKKSILFIVDKPNWAYEYMVKVWVPYLFSEYDCYITYQQDYFIKPFDGKVRWWVQLKSYFIHTLSYILNKDKLTYFVSDNKRYYYPKRTKNKVYQFDAELNKTLVDRINFDIITEMAFYFQYTAEIPFTAPRKIVGIFTDKFPHDGPNVDIKENIDRSLLDRKSFYDKYLSSYDYIIVGGGNLEKEYKKLSNRVQFVYGIFGQNNFIENKTVGKKEGLIIGWTGTPKRPMKGFESIILPAMEMVKNTGRKVELKTKFSGAYEELYPFYQDIDLVVIASDADSGPSLYAEACLAGVPVISTKVGLPLMGIKDGENGYFFERNPEALAEKIIKLYDEREILVGFSERVKKDYLTWMDNAKTIEYFKKVLSN
ncbi:glycosyltransferase [Riemerella anatipestifer]|uniref:glycosyltransferase n=1 Tax=Riemerella anatipestifer TaxID=34085 RepID=UPI00129DB8C9|nr:glycosyltransferase [Riemerella anatipestifer]MRM82870.1 glycosyltransferase [Riemerella anatipestifer]